MLSKHDERVVRSLRIKKHREAHGLFVVEGIKSIREVLRSGFEVKRLFCTADALSSLGMKRDYPCQLITEKELDRISFLTTPNKALALCALPVARSPEIGREWVIALDGLSDPGNLGTILRLADWFGVSKILASSDTVDVYNPKAIQASMGSFARVRVFYTELADFFAHTPLPVWGACVEGEAVYRLSFPSAGILLMGAEHSGISPALASGITQKVNIPKFHPNSAVESLNVAMATAILLNELRRPID